MLDLVAEFEEITKETELEERKSHPVSWEQLLKENPKLAAQQKELDEARKELVAVRQVHARLKEQIERACPPTKLDMITELVAQNDQLAF